MTGPQLVPSDGLPWLGPVPLPDCRTCAHFLESCEACMAVEDGARCFRGSKFKPMPPIELWGRT
jgi:hypothetical protein